MNDTILISWIGMTDLQSCKTSLNQPSGPVAQTVAQLPLNHIYLLSDFDKKTNIHFSKWLQQFSPCKPVIKEVTLTSPMNFEEIYNASITVCKQIINTFGNSSNLVFHISPGTSAMAAVFILIAKTQYPGKIIQSSIEHGVETVFLPFDISLDFIPQLLEHQDTHIQDQSIEEPQESSSFNSIIYRSEEMSSAIRLAKKIAYRSVPVLLEGESGTGKELFARAIHNASPWKSNPFIVINCGAIPQELFESEFFGYEKGAFTGAATQKIGVFESAHNGTVFLDEIGELPHSQQVKLLRVLQEKTIRRVGGVKEIPLNIRIIAATNKELITEVQNGAFREDLFYRLAIAIIKLPALRERKGDISLLVDHILEMINSEYSKDSGYARKILSAGAKQALYNYSWPGNIRELINTLRRAALWSDSEIITTVDINLSFTIIHSNKTKKDYDYISLIQKKSFNFEEEINLIVKDWISYVLDQTQGNKTKAAMLLGMNNYQTLNNWIKRVEM